MLVGRDISIELRVRLARRRRRRGGVRGKWRCLYVDISDYFAGAEGGEEG